MISWIGRSTPLVILLLWGNVTFGQSVISYATVRIPSGFSLLANPLSAGITNGANEIGLLIDGEQILTWNGRGFDFYSYSAVDGWRDAAAQPVSAPSLPPGTGFFFFNPGAATTQTFLGRVIPGPGTTNRVILQPGYSLVGSSLPANVSKITSAPVSLPLIEGMQILTWNGSAYVYSSYDSSFGGWVDADLQPAQAPSYSVGQGFFIFNPGPAVTWEQSLP